jgi:hypothetical protein
MSLKDAPRRHLKAVTKTFVSITIFMWYYISYHNIYGQAKCGFTAERVAEGRAVLRPLQQIVMPLWFFCSSMY